MRTATNDTSISENHLSLGHGYCAEHEFGYSVLSNKLGVSKYPSGFEECFLNPALLDKTPTSIEDFKIQNPDQIVFFEKEVKLPKPSANPYGYDEKVYELFWQEYVEQFKKSHPARKTIASIKTKIACLWTKSDYHREATPEEFFKNSGFFDCFSRYNKYSTATAVILPLINADLCQKMNQDASSDSKAALFNAYLDELSVKFNKTISKRKYFSDPLSCSGVLQVLWGSSDFSVCAVGEKAEALSKLWAQIKDKEAFLGFRSATDPFGRGSLCIYTQNLISPEEEQKVSQQWEEFRENVRNAHEKFGTLLKSNKFYSFRGPSKNQEGQDIYWLNPTNQQQYNSGWFTEEQIKLWLVENKGPIVKSA